MRNIDPDIKNGLFHLGRAIEKSGKTGKSLAQSAGFKKMLFDLAEKYPKELEHTLDKAKKKCIEAAKNLSADGDLDGGTGSSSQKRPKITETDDEDDDKHASEDDNLDVEMKIIRRDPPEKIVNHCLYKLGNSNESVDCRRKSLDEIFDVFPNLYPERLSEELSESLSNQLVKPSISTGPRVCDMEDPIELFHALQNFTANTEDIKIHQAYGRKRLYETVEAQAWSKSRKISSSVFEKAPHIEILEDLAQKIAGPVSAKAREKQQQKRCISHYHGGKHWVKIIEDFGGPGIVIMFIVGGEITQ